MIIRDTVGRGALILLALVGMMRPVGAQVDVRARAREMLPTAVFQQLEAMARDAEGEGVPVAPLFDKAVEGIAKGVPVDRILPAVAAQAERLRTVRGLLGDGVEVAVVVAGGDALMKGVPGESLRQLGPTERTPMALLVLGDLVEAGVGAEDAVNLVRDAVGRPVGERDLLALTSTVRRLLRGGRTPRAAADAIRRALRDGRPIDRLPGVGRDGGGGGAPAPPGSEPVRRDRRTGGSGAER